MRTQEQPSDRADDAAHSPRHGENTQENTAHAVQAVHSGGMLTPQMVLTLQRAIGNAAMVRLAEQQHVHDASCSASGLLGEQAPAAPTVQRSSVHEVLRSPGRPMEQSLRTEMEARLGADFSAVRIHANPQAQRSAAELGARAYTSREHIVVGSGGGDKKTMAHELTHVLQQRNGAVSGTRTADGLSVSDPSDHFERAAEANAARVMAAPLDAAVQRAPSGGHSSVRLSTAESGGAGEAARAGTGQPAIQRALTVQVGVDSSRDSASPSHSNSPSPARARPSVASTVITKVLIQGRPDHLFVGGEGSHTTAWAVYGDSVRRAIVGRSMRQALVGLEQLVHDAIVSAPVIPKNKKSDAKEAKGRKKLIDANADKVTDVIAGARRHMQAGESGLAVSALQQAIAEYLRVRNEADFAVAFLGKGLAVGHGEPQNLEKLRTFEVTGSGFTPAHLREYLWELLDGDPFSPAGLGKLNSETIRGYRNGNHAVDSMIARHLHEIHLAYPLAYAHSNIEAAMPGDRGGGSPGRPRPRPRAADPAPAGWSRGVGEPDVPMAVQFVLRSSGGGSEVITSVQISGRHPTLLGGQGHHTTSHIAYAAGVERAVMGKSLAAARDGLIELIDTTKALPQVPKIPTSTRGSKKAEKAAQASSFALTVTEDELEESEEGEEAARARDEFYLGTVGRLDALLKQVGDAGTFNANQLGLTQELASAYLAFRNALPLAAVLAGSPANYSGEAELRSRLNADEDRTAARRTASKISADMLGFLDTGSLNFVNDDEMARSGAPGSADNADMRVEHTLTNHAVTMKQSWPDAFDRAHLSGAIEPHFENKGITVNDLESIVTRVRNASGEVESAVAANSRKKKRKVRTASTKSASSKAREPKKKKNDDDDEWTH